MTETGDFYEDDEPIEKVREDWRRGEPGLTKGPRDLNQRGRAAVDAVIARWDSDEDDESISFTSDVRSMHISGARLLQSGLSVRPSETVRVST